MYVYHGWNLGTHLLLGQIDPLPAVLQEGVAVEVALPELAGLRQELSLAVHLVLFPTPPAKLLRISIPGLWMRKLPHENPKDYPPRIQQSKYLSPSFQNPAGENALYYYITRKHETTQTHFSGGASLLNAGRAGSWPHEAWVHSS